MYSLILLVMMHTSSGLHSDSSFVEETNQISSFTIKKDLSVTDCFKELDYVGLNHFDEHGTGIYTRIYKDSNYSNKPSEKEVYTLLTCQTKGN